MTRKTKKKRSPAMVYAVRYGDLDALKSFHYIFVDFKNKVALNMVGKEFAIGDNFVRDRFWVLNNKTWKWVNKHEAVKIRIGGLPYVKEYYHRPNGTHVT